ncbi:hypothetical protein LIER_09414 [Lithospermum erythrorhizon]|uniref:Uncharacterized protein n=1 Tax=Lithospermum erythrorhizon TaxID=34254 RepID=A0AAV3PJX6_LITER
MWELGYIAMVKNVKEIGEDLLAEVIVIFDSNNRLQKTPKPPSICFRNGKLDPIEKILELARHLPNNHDFSDNMLFVFKSCLNFDLGVYVINCCEQTKRVELFHVAIMRAVHQDSDIWKTDGYAFIVDRLYFVGGHPHDVLDKFAKFEVLDTNTDAPWTPFPPPMFDMEYYSHHFFDHANGVFHLFLKKNPEDDDEAYEEEEEDEDEDYAWCHLDLKASSLQWGVWYDYKIIFEALLS